VDVTREHVAWVEFPFLRIAVTLCPSLVLAGIAAALVRVGSPRIVVWIAAEFACIIITIGKVVLPPVVPVAIVIGTVSPPRSRSQP
jgi:hypothetical protein